MAALDGHPLPSLPQPTHDFPQTNRLQINLRNGELIQPIKAENGVALHPFVTIDDAIDDLPRFDWYELN
jgi:DNA (cytosine-5)-methyltransferase 1